MCAMLAAVTRDRLADQILTRSFSFGTRWLSIWNLSSIDDLQFCEKLSSVDQHMFLILQQIESMFAYKSKYLSKIL